ncbi:hypothetical protein BFW86_02055 [Pseudomonas fluorescens]|nr:hypothetical protein BFW86_02055 [Pseudomonas fluorescens]
MRACRRAVTKPSRQHCCGERACPAPGCEAAPPKTPRCIRENSLDGFRAASQPSAGQARSPQLHKVLTTQP